jgi:imidazolonepropionase-like amidohydrolase
MHRVMRFSLLATLACSVVAQARAQLGSFNPPPGPRETVAIRNARIVTVSGPVIPNGTVVIADGKIQAVGANAAVPAGARTIDASGLSVYPGMMDAGTSLGLSEIGQGANATVDNSEVGSFNPNAQAIYAVNPHSAHIGVTRVVGITHAISRPTGSILAGQATLINLAGSTAPQMTVVQRIAMVAELPRSGFGGRGGGRGGAAAAAGAANTQDVNRTVQRQLDSLRTMLRDAAAYGKAHDAYAKDRSIPRPKSDVVLASLVPVVRGEMPVMFVADRAPDIREAIAFAEEMHLKPIIVGGRDAWQIAAFLKDKNVPVLLTGILSLPSREDDPYDVNYAAPAKLAAAGVRFAITSGESGAEVRNLPYVAGMAAAFGLSKEDALRSVTLWPAEIFGVADRLGSIEVGKMANLVVTDGDILEARTNTKYLFIDGRNVPLDTKHSALNALFKDRQ